MLAENEDQNTNSEIKIKESEDDQSNQNFEEQVSEKEKIIAQQQENQKSNSEEFDYNKQEQEYDAEYWEAFEDLLRKTQIQKKEEEANLAKNKRDLNLIRFQTESNVINSTDELNKYKYMIKEEKKNFPTLRALLSNINIREKIANSIAHIDLTTLPKFAKQIMCGTTNNEIVQMLRNEGGDYLKKQASILYYLNLLKNKYGNGSIDIDPKDADTKPKNQSSINSEDVINAQSKVKVIYGNNSCLINLCSNEKRCQYTFQMLKNDSCEMWSIPQNQRKEYHIVNDKLQVFSPRILVWEVHKNYHEKHLRGEWECLELLDKMSIFLEKNAMPRKRVKEHIKLAIDEDIHKAETSERNNIFISEIEEYVLFYRRVEAMILFFKKDKVLLQLKKEKIEKIKEIEKITKEKLLNPDLFKENEDEEFIKIKAKCEQDKVQSEFEEKKMLHKSKREDAIYLSSKTIFLYKLGKFWYFILNLLFAVSFFYAAANFGQISLREMNDMERYLTESVFFSPIYQNFFKKTKPYDKKDFSALITSKRDLAIWLSILFNNMIFENENQENETNSNYTAVFIQPRALYEVYLGTQFNFKLGDSMEKANEAWYIKFAENYEKNLTIFEEHYSPVNEDSEPQPILSSEILEVLNNFNENDQICLRCASTQKFFYSNITTQSLIYEGTFSYYEPKGYQFYTSPFKLSRELFNGITIDWMSNFLSNRNLRALLINLNINSKFHDTLVKYTILFEFSVMGNVKSTLFCTPLNTSKNSRIWLISGFVDVQKYIFLAFLVFNLFSFIVSPVRLRTNRFSIFYDLVVSLFLFIYNFVFADAMAKIELASNMKVGPGNYTSIELQNFFSNTLRYYEFLPFVNDQSFLYQIAALTTLLLFLRLIFSLMASPLIKYIVQTLILSLANSANIIVILLVCILSFSFMLHAVLGVNENQFASLGTAIIVSLLSILGTLQISSFGELNNVTYFMFIFFLIIIKYFLYVFIFAFIKETNKDLKIQFSKYKKTKHFRLVGDSVFEFSKYCLIPISFYFMIKKYLTMRALFNNINLQKFVEEGEVRSKK